MNQRVKPIPEGYHSVTPYIQVNDVAQALEFYKSAFGAEELYRLEMKPGVIVHAEFKIGNSIMMITGMTPGMKPSQPPCDYRTVSFMLYVEDVDAAATKAKTAGMKVIKEVQNQFYGDRAGSFEDPFGHVWSIGSHVEDVSAEEVAKRMRKLYGEENK
ncbi:MAG: VOC family protein [Bacteriovorax sp.]